MLEYKIAFYINTIDEKILDQLFDSMASLLKISVPTLKKSIVKDEFILIATLERQQLIAIEGLLFDNQIRHKISQLYKTHNGPLDIDQNSVDSLLVSKYDQRKRRFVEQKLENTSPESPFISPVKKRLEDRKISDTLQKIDFDAPVSAQPKNRQSDSAMKHAPQMISSGLRFTTPNAEKNTPPSTPTSQSSTAEPVHEQKYCLIFNGKHQDYLSLEQAKLNLAKIFHTDTKVIEHFFDGNVHILKGDLDASSAKEYWKIFEQYGLFITINKQ